MIISRGVSVETGPFCAPGETRCKTQRQYEKMDPPYVGEKHLEWKGKPAQCIQKGEVVETRMKGGKIDLSFVGGT